MSAALEVKWLTDSVRVEIHPDPYPENPLTDYAIGRHAYFHRRYNLGNCGDEFRTPEELDDYFRANIGKFVAWPVYMYDHSGLAFSLGASFACPWDSGQIGFAFMLKSDIREGWNCKRVTRGIQDKVQECLKGELESYERYINGGYVGYQVMRRDDVLDSCWGIDDSDYAMELGLEAADSWLHDDAEAAANEG